MVLCLLSNELTVSNERNGPDRWCRVCPHRDGGPARSSHRNYRCPPDRTDALMFPSPRVLESLSIHSEKIAKPYRWPRKHISATHSHISYLELAEFTQEV